MLSINECGLGTAAHDKMTLEILRHIENGESSYLIVPEQQTVIAEAEMTAALPERAPLYFEVTNFTRLCDTVFRKVGGIGTSYADRGTKALLMWRTLVELSGTLNLTRGARDINDGITSRAKMAVAELDSHAIDDDAISSLLEDESLGEGLRKKLSDVMLIRSYYKKLLHEKYTGTDEAEAALAEKIRENPEIFRDTDVFIEGFTSFTEPQYKIISALMRCCRVTVHLPISKSTEAGFEFLEIRATKERLISLARREGCDIKLIRESDFDPQKPLLLTELTRLIWRTEGEIDNDTLQNTDSLRIFEAETPFEVCDLVAADIKRRVMDGASYSDFAIIARDTKRYLGILDISLFGAGIPYFMSESRELFEFEAVKFIFSVYSAASHGLMREDVISALKCSFLDVSREDADEFEIYTERWGITGKRFLDVFNMNPDGYTVRHRDDMGEQLLRINAVREAFITPISELGDKISGTHTVREHAELLYGFLKEISLPEKLSQRALDAAERGESYAEYLSVWKHICHALDTIVEVLGDTEVTADGFISELRVLLSQYTVGKIPSYVDEVTVGGAEGIRITGKKHVYLIGANSGELPMNVRDESYFTERDKAELSALGLSIAPDMEIRCARELFFISRLLAAAEESVTLLYSTAGTDYKPLEPSDMIKRIAECTRGAVVPISSDSLSPTYKIYTKEKLKESYSSLHGAYREGAKMALSALGEDIPEDSGAIKNGTLTLSPETVDGMYGGGIALTQSRIDSFSACPIKYFCSYNLKLDGGAEYEMNSGSVGSYVHAVLESFFRDTERAGLDAAELSQKEREEMILNASRRYLKELSGEDAMTPMAKSSLAKIYKMTLPVVEDICREIRGSQFKPRFFELEIRNGKGENPDPIVFRDNLGRRVSVFGTIDRVDTFKSGDDVYVRVLDYKTGAKKFSPDDLARGENLQMFLYLKAIVDTDKPEFLKKAGVGEGGRLIPAGVIYVKTEIGDVSVEHDSGEETLEKIKAGQGRSGMILNDPASIGAQNAEYLPVKYKKDGTPTAAGERLLYTEDGWRELTEVVKESVLSVSERMRSGELVAGCGNSHSHNNPCEYCDYKAFCRKAFS